MTTRKHIAALIAAVALMALSFALVRGVWAVGDAQCEAARHVEMLPAYGYPVTVDPCNDAWAGQWLAPAW